MIRETMIDAERDYVDERPCGVNDMTFEEWKRYQDYMIRDLSFCLCVCGGGGVNFKGLNRKKADLIKEGIKFDRNVVRGDMNYEFVQGKYVF